MKLKHEQIQYIEFLSINLERAEKFYNASFGWTFQDYGPDYTAFESDYIDGGFMLGRPRKGSTLVILYSEKLEDTKMKIQFIYVSIKFKYNLAICLVLFY